MIRNLVISLALLVLVLASRSFAGDFEWSGNYRIEGVHVTNPLLDSSKREKEYGLHHLVLKPKITAADGITIWGRFDILNSATFANNQMGQFFGSGVGSTGTTTDNNNTLSQNQKAETLSVTQLYINFYQEFGVLVAGRAPLHFGLGMTHNGGEGPFDHYMDTRDLVGYKMIFGNISFTPIIAKVAENSLMNGDDVTDYIAKIDYENLESGLKMGAMYDVRKASQAGNDAPGTPVYGDVASPTAVGNYEVSLLNVFASRKSKTQSWALEASFQSGKTGINDSNLDEVNVSGSGVALEYKYMPADSKWSFGLNAGHATGDNPNTTNKYEGFIFDRNYDVAFLLMNHALGKASIFRTDAIGGGSAKVTNSPDVEAISNVTYISPTAHFAWKDKYGVSASLTTGFLGETKNLTGASKTTDSNIGYELDISLSFMPNKNIIWKNEIGILMPGAAFKVDGTYDSDLAYGVTTKAAIRF